MAKIDFNLQFSDAWHRAERDPNAAAEAWLIVAALLRNAHELTPDIRDCLAGALEASMIKPQAHRGPTLLRKLRLTAGNRRPVNVDDRAVGRSFDEAIAAGQSQNASATQVAVQFGISESTAISIWKEHRRIEENIDAIRYDDDGR